MLGGEPGAAPSAEETFVARSSLEAFDALAVDHRAVLLLVVVEGLPYQDAAHALVVPVGTVMSRLSRARAAYRRPNGDEPGGARLRRIGRTTRCPTTTPCRPTSMASHMKPDAAASRGAYPGTPRRPPACGSGRPPRPASGTAHT